MQTSWVAHHRITAICIYIGLRDDVTFLIILHSFSCKYFAHVFSMHNNHLSFALPFHVYYIYCICVTYLCVCVCVLFAAHENVPIGFTNPFFLTGKSGAHAPRAFTYTSPHQHTDSKHVPTMHQCFAYYLDYSDAQDKIYRSLIILSKIRNLYRKCIGYSKIN